MNSLKLSKLLEGRHIGPEMDIKLFGDILDKPSKTNNTLFWIKNNLRSFPFLGKRGGRN